MNKKAIIAAVSALAALAAVTLWLMLSLFSDKKQESRPTPSSKAHVSATLSAIPSDAVVVFSFDGSSKAEKLLSDSTGVLRAFMAPDTPVSFMRYLSSVSSMPTAVSLHNSGSLTPLVVTELGKTDSLTIASISQKAEAVGLGTRYFEGRGLLIASKSETLLSTSIRHLETGMSVLDSEGFEEALSRVDSHCNILISGLYAGKIFQVYAPSKRRDWADFLKAFSVWTSLGVESVSEDGFVLSGSASVRDDKYLSSFVSQGDAQHSFAEILPPSVSRSVSVAFSSPKAYFDDHSVYFSARYGKVDIPTEWLERAGVKEVAFAVFPEGDSERRVTLLRTGKDLNVKGIVKNTHEKDLRVLFGEAFVSTSDSLMTSVRGGWTVFGDAPSLEAFSSLSLSGGSLKDRLSSADAAPSKQSGAVAYISADGNTLSEVFSKPVADALKIYAGGVPLSPVVVSAGMADGVPAISITVRKTKTDAPLEAIPVGGGLVIPEGPFKVTNSSTGKQNTLYQNSHLSICLQDENGKDQWGIPFKEKICGMVRDIDFYNNGRIQFLFAAGSKLYLLDRLGRIVTGFPVDTGKAIVLGPEVYDFTGSKGYRAMVIHEDNTIELYNLHGQKPEGWKGIAPQGSISSMPQLQEVDSVKYWFVPTSAGIKIYGFLGGDPLSDKEAAKIMKRTKTK